MKQEPGDQTERQETYETVNGRPSTRVLKIKQGNETEGEETSKEVREVVVEEEAAVVVVEEEEVEEVDKEPITTTGN